MQVLVHQISEYGQIRNRISIDVQRYAPDFDQSVAIQLRNEIHDIDLCEHGSEKVGYLLLRQQFQIALNEFLCELHLSLFRLVLLDDDPVHISETSAGNLFGSVDRDVARGEETHVVVQVDLDVLLEKCDHACCAWLAALWLILIVIVSFFLLDLSLSYIV